VSVNTGDASEMPLNRARAAHSALWSAVENGGLALVSFASLVVYARFLPAADFGVFSIALALIELLDVVVSMLFHDAIVQRSEVSALHVDTAFTFTLGLSLALFGLCAAAAPAFGHLVHHPQAAGILLWTALRFPCTALGAIIVAQQRRELAFRVLALRSLVGRLTGAGIGIALVVRGAGIWGLVAQQVLIALTGSLVLWMTASRRPRLRFRMDALRPLLRFGVYAVGALFLTFAVKRLFTILAGVWLGNEGAGYLNMAFRAVDVLWAIAATAVTQVALPVLARLQSDPERRRRAYRAAIELTCLLLYPCFAGIALLAPEVVGLLFGARWQAASPLVTALALLTVIQAPRLLMTPMLTAIGRPREPLIGLAIEITIVLLLCIPAALTPQLSLASAIGVWMLREVASAPVMMYRLDRATGISIREQLVGARAPLLASVAMALVLIVIRRVLPDGLGAAARVAILVPAGALAFLAALCSGAPAALRGAIGFFTSVTGVAPPGGATTPPHPIAQRP
jgi:PST family polysaccharide transporter